MAQIGETLFIYTELAGIRNSFFYFYGLTAVIGVGLLIVEVGHIQDHHIP